MSKTRSRASVHVHGARGLESGFASVTGSGRAQTPLSRSLGPPARPWAARGWAHASAAAFVLMFLTALVVNALLGSAASSSAALVVGVWFLIAHRRRHRVAHPQWLERRAVWARLFYCRRCDGVFLPADVAPAHLRGRFVERHAMPGFLAGCTPPQ
ncbi:hypothetical protein OG948_60225 (plasmid) [Embleya sp. NBC_00888]|uniref:hypothetical protein n=1 Tax=Embleya sp. NBC_00888 TaxID=2975960 RepID=UPI00386402A5|nr:hypothetical protein OG948_60225 [Embleya sp. NBC_00888]